MPLSNESTTDKLSALMGEDQSRSNSLIAVFERVFSSTRFTITAQ
jgi:hypothetical protein